VATLTRISIHHTQIFADRAKICDAGGISTQTAPPIIWANNAIDLKSHLTSG
jgi:hypothetical protein